MLPFSLNTRRRFFLAATLFALSFVIAYYFETYIPHMSIPNPRLNTQVTKDNRIKVTANTELIQKKVYLRCGDEEALRSKPTDNLIGMDISQVQKAFPGWAIDKFDSDALELSMKVDDYCPDHANNYFIGIKDGRVAVFYGKPGPKAIMKEMTNIPVNALSGEDLEQLQKGLPVKSHEELLRILEGMQGR